MTVPQMPHLVLLFLVFILFLSLSKTVHTRTAEIFNNLILSSFIHPQAVQNLYDFFIL